MLSTLLGIIVAFITVILLLSLVVMALVQITQVALRLRARNLLVGLGAFIEAEAIDKNLPAPATATRPGVTSPRRSVVPGAPDKKVIRAMAADVLSRTTAAKLRFDRDPNSLLSVIRGPATSWADANDIAETIERLAAVKSGQLPTVDQQQAATSTQGELAKRPPPITPVPPLGDNTPRSELAAKFKALEPALSDRFARHMQMWTAIWGVVVAFVFQVNAPDLLKTLSLSEAKREAILAMVPDVVKQAEEAIPAALADDFVDRALEKLSARYPSRADLAVLFPQVSGSTDARDEMLQELRNVLAGVPDRDAIVRAYADIIDEANRHDFQKAFAAAGDAMDSLASIDIRPWSRAWSFYGSGANWLGVAITAILLSFGAPFWFDQLRNVAALRDALSRRPAASR